LLLLLFFLPFTWGRHRRPHATTVLPGATSLELLILFAITPIHHASLANNLRSIPVFRGSWLIQKSRL
jgi:hypothetical protein